MNNRWYDQEPTCRKLIEQISAMPSIEARTFSARVLIHFVEKLRKEMHLKGMSLNSIGAPAISSLYKFGQRKERWYDQDSVLHKAVATLYTLSPEGLGIIGFKLGDTLGLIQVYDTVCNQVDQPPDPKDLTQISVTALRAGKKEAHDVLISIVGEDLYRSLGLKDVKPTGDLNQGR